MVVVTVCQDHDIVHGAPVVQGQSVVILDLERFDEVSQALDVNLRVIRGTTTPGVNEEDSICGRYDFRINVRLLRVYIVVFLDEKVLGVNRDAWNAARLVDWVLEYIR